MREIFTPRRLLSLFYPSFCCSCEVLIQQDSVFCYKCAKKIKPIVSSFLPLTKNKSIKVFAVSDYKDPLRPLILRKAYSNVLASRQLAQIIFESNLISNLKIDFIIPVPLHWTRYSRRGFNQSCVMAKFLSKRMNVPVLNILKRKKRTIFQSRLPYKERQENVKDVFDFNFRYKFYDKNSLKNKNFLLIDDLCTTGATLKNAGRLLLDLDPASVNAVVACRVV